MRVIELVGGMEDDRSDQDMLDNGVRKVDWRDADSIASLPAIESTPAKMKATIAPKKSIIPDSGISSVTVLRYLFSLRRIAMKAVRSTMKRHSVTWRYVLLYSVFRINSGPGKAGEIAA